MMDHGFGLLPMPAELPAWSGRCAVYHDTSGTPQGFVRYHVDDRWESRVSHNLLVVDDLVAVTADAYARLWQLCVETDTIATVQAADRRPDELLPWLLYDARSARESERSDFLWLRLLDVPAALSTRRYLRPGRIVLEVTDPAGYAAGRFSLDGGGDGGDGGDGGAGAECRRTGQTAHLTLPVTALGAAYLGGTALRTLADAGLVVEHRPGALAVADAMFRSDVVPWCNTWF